MILLAHISTGRSIVKEIRSHNIKEWMFLCRDYSKLLFYEDILNGTATLIQTGRILNSKVEEFRVPFLNLMAELAERYDSIEWWATRLAEKNTLIDNLFLNTCYLSLASDIVKKHKDICIISDSWSILKSLNNLYNDSLILKPFRALSDCLKRIFKKYVYIIYFFFLQVSKYFLAKLYCKKLTSNDLTNKKRVLLFTYVEPKSLSKEGKFYDRYFTVLPHWLEEKGYEVITYPKVLNIKTGILESFRWFRDTFQWFKKADGKFLIEYNYYRLSDYFYCLWIFLKQKRFQFKNIYLLGFNLDKLFSERKEMEQIHEGMLLYRLPKRLVENNINVDVYIDSHENMILEKMFRLGIKKYMPGTKIISYQHAPFFPNLLCMYFVGKEFNYAPDRLICSGKMMMQLIENMGFPKERLIQGPALRYNYLYNLKIQRAEKNKGKKIILIMLPLEETLLKELLVKVYYAFRDNKDCDFLFKLHPFTPKETLLGFFIENRWEMPENFRLTDEELYSLIGKIDCCILMATTSLLELYIIGLPLINVGSEVSLAHDPTEWFSSYISPVYNIEELRRKLEILLKEGISESECKLSLKDIFEPINDDLMEAFIS